MSEKGNLSIHSENIFPIIKKWLYSDHDIFVRELISNASDAMTKLKKLVSLGEASLKETPEYRIDVELDDKNKTLVFKDNGIGMTDEEIKKYINQIAFSGAEDFLEKYKDKEDMEQIIGHFGLGFYSAFMVADKVEIDSLSYQENASPAHWVCDGGIDYEMTKGNRSKHGTSITLHLGQDGSEFLNEWTLKKVIKKYCSFMPYPIYFTNINEEEEKDEDGNIIVKDQIPLNTPKPLYTKSPSDISDEEYKNFYRETFNDFKEPLFWIHLNMDYPFRLKGILYFPRFNNEFETIEGQIKLYNSQVFIADNIKEVIPEFLLLLKGVIDCPDLPLNVSRSSLQNDGFVQKISDYISKKVADKLVSLFKKNRKDEYEKYWQDIHPFVKFGCLKDEKFMDKISPILLFKNIDGNYLTIEEYLEKAKSKDEKSSHDEDCSCNKDDHDHGENCSCNKDDHDHDENCSCNKDDHDHGENCTCNNDEKKTIYYFNDRQLQASYINMFKEYGMDAIELAHNIDQPLISHLEIKNNKITFQRIDADLDAAMKSDEKMSEDVAKSMSETLQAIFRKSLNLDNLNVRVEGLKSKDISGLIILSEESRRMQDMYKMYGLAGMDMANIPSDETLVLNKNNLLVKYLLENPNAPEDKIKIFSQQIYDLALLSYKQLPADRMTAFIDRTNKILEELIKS